MVPRRLLRVRRSHVHQLRNHREQMPALFGESVGRGFGAVAQWGRIGLRRRNGTVGRDNGPCQQIVMRRRRIKFFFFCESLYLCLLFCIYLFIPGRDLFLGNSLIIISNSALLNNTSNHYLLYLLGHIIYNRDDGRMRKTNKSTYVGDYIINIDWRSKEGERLLVEGRYWWAAK